MFLFSFNNFIFMSSSFNRSIQLLRLREAQNVVQLPIFFFFLFLCQSSQGLRHCKLVFLILKISQYGGPRWSVFSKVFIHKYSKYSKVRTDIWIDIFIPKRSVATKFGKQLHLGKLIQVRLLKQVLVMSLRHQVIRQTKTIISLLPQYL